jgi:hypothetical protein
VRPGIADATVPNPLFNLTRAPTVDEGNNFVVNPKFDESLFTKAQSDAATIKPTLAKTK